jgi:hypothetical protein
MRKRQEGGTAKDKGRGIFMRRRRLLPDAIPQTVYNVWQYRQTATKSLIFINITQTNIS